MLKAKSPDPVVVRFFPDYRETNPYQTLLYGALGPGFATAPVGSAADLMRVCDEAEAGCILHLHWETAAFTTGEMSPEGFLDTLSRLRDRGGRIVWTMHNLSPHDPRYRKAADVIRSGILALADIVHIHSIQALAAAMEESALDPAKVRIIPHGNYEGVYPAITRADAKRTLDLEGAGMVALLPGQIRAYKAPGSLIEAFLGVASADDRLILAGHRWSDVDDVAIPDDRRILYTPGFQAPEAFARMHAAADFVVLPYVRSLTSGSAILAQTLGRGILGSDTPGLRDAVDVPSTGTLFDFGTPGALTEALAAALGEGPEVWAARGQSAIRAAKARNWPMIGATWRDVFNDLARRPRCAREPAG